jgi:hypothetical protein
MRLGEFAGVPRRHRAIDATVVCSGFCCRPARQSTIDDGGEGDARYRLAPPVAGS